MASERIKHSGPDTKFCVLCLSGEHERVDAEEPPTLTCPTCGPTSLGPHPRLPVQRCTNCKEHLQAAFTPPAHYRRDDGVDCCVHAIPVGPNSCPACRELAIEDAPPLPSAIRLDTQWCWDPLYPHLRCRVRIVDTRWDGVLWWVKTEALSDSDDRRAGNQRLHTLDRFIESTVAVDDV